MLSWRWPAILLLILAPFFALSRPTPVAAAETDFGVANGWFYTQASGRGDDGRWGYRITDDGGVRFWTEFQRFGGVPAVGYPASTRFVGNGFVLQATQKFVLQWRPEIGQVWYVNIFDLMHDAGLDDWLLRVRQVPPPESTAEDAGLTWDQVIARHFTILDRNDTIKAAYLANPDPLTYYGLPMAYADLGNVLVLRAQRAVFQQWKQDTPWAKAGQITIANGGDVAKEAGMLPSEAIGPERSPRSGTIRWAYYTKWDPASWESLQAAADALDYVSPFYFSVDGRGVITGEPEARTDQFLRARGIRNVPTFKNGANYDAFRPVLVDPTVRRQSIEAIVRIVETNRYDGVNIDYESLFGSDRDALTAYLAELSAILRPRGKIVTTAVAAKTADTTAGWAGAYDYAALARYNDLIFVMAYGFRVAGSATPGSIAPVDWVDRVAAYTVSRIPAGKVVLGLGWYGYDWNLTDRSATTSVRHRDALAKAQQLGATVAYDEREQVAYFRYRDGAAAREVWFETAPGIAAKTRAAVKHGISAIGGWRLGQEDPAIWPAYRHWTGR